MQEFNDPKMVFSADGPYPAVRVEKRNCSYAKAMLDNVGGTDSEISAVSLYFYDHLISTDFEEVSACFHKISIVEMHHLEIFGSLARQLGEDPRLWTQKNFKKVYWSPSYNYYTFSLKELLNYALQGELNTIQKYTDQISYIKDPDVAANLQRIILDEKVHVSIFERLIKKYC
jgi:bacterioferritin